MSVWTECTAGWGTWRAAEVNKEDKERERERGKVRSSLSSVAVERTDALELPGTNSSSSRGLFLEIPIFQKELFITPLAKYNKKVDGECNRESGRYIMSPCNLKSSA